MRLDALRQEGPSETPRTEAEGLHKGTAVLGTCLGLKGRAKDTALLSTLTHIKTSSWSSHFWPLINFRVFSLTPILFLKCGKCQPRSKVCSKEATQPRCSCTSAPGSCVALGKWLHVSEVGLIHAGRGGTRVQHADCRAVEAPGQSGTRSSAAGRAEAERRATHSKGCMLLAGGEDKTRLPGDTPAAAR